MTTLWEWSDGPDDFASKRRRLTEDTHHILNSTWDWKAAANDVIDRQNDVFDASDSEIRRLQRTLRQTHARLEECIRAKESISSSLRAKDSLLVSKQRELNSMRANVNALKTEIDCLNMEVFENRQASDDLKKHYKSLVSGLQKNMTDGSRSSSFLDAIRHVVRMFEASQDIDCLFNTIDSKMCTICLEQPACVVCQPCRHVEYCRPCAIIQYSLEADSLKFTDETVTAIPCPRCKYEVCSLELVYA